MNICLESYNLMCNFNFSLLVSSQNTEHELEEEKDANILVGEDVVFYYYFRFLTARAMIYLSTLTVKVDVRQKPPKSVENEKLLMITWSVVV